jgi:hypothetical protein
MDLLDELLGDATQAVAKDEDVNFFDQETVVEETSATKEKAEEISGDIVDEVVEISSEDELFKTDSERAIEKLQAELEAMKTETSLGMKGRMIAPSVCKTLTGFAQNTDFAEAILLEDKTLIECLKTIMQGPNTNAISDLYVYQKAAEYYIPGVAVSFKMFLTIDGVSTPSEHDGAQEGPLEKPEMPKPPKTENKKSPKGGKKASKVSPEEQAAKNKKAIAETEQDADSGKKVIQLDLFSSLQGAV